MSGPYREAGAHYGNRTQMDGHGLAGRADPDLGLSDGSGLRQQMCIRDSIYPYLQMLGCLGFMIGTGGSALVAMTLGMGCLLYTSTGSASKPYLRTINRRPPGKFSTTGGGCC